MLKKIPLYIQFVCPSCGGMNEAYFTQKAIVGPKIEVYTYLGEFCDGEIAISIKAGSEEGSEQVSVRELRSDEGGQIDIKSVACGAYRDYLLMLPTIERRIQDFSELGRLLGLPSGDIDRFVREGRKLRVDDVESWQRLVEGFISDALQTP